MTSALAAPTVAILGDAGDRAFAELSKRPGLALVEREMLPQAALERALGEAREGVLQPWELVSADGLLLVEPTPDGFSARLFSTHNGLCVWQTEWRTGGEDPWPVLAREIEGAAPKLVLAPGEVLPVGILGLRPATAHPHAAERARSLTRAVELRLASLPGVVLLERRQLGGAAFERALREQNPELARSARLLDGSFDVVNGRWEADVLVRGMDGSGDGVLRLDADDLNGLADGIAAQLTGQPARVSDGKSEATAFVKEAQRAERAGLDTLALDLAETAQVLGDESSELAALMARLHARLAGGEDPYSHDNAWYETPEEARPALARQRAEHAFLALAYFEKSGQKDRQLILNACSVLLRLLDKEAPAAADREALRAKLRQAAPFDPTGARPPYHLPYGADFAPTWAESPEEVIAFHRAWLRSSHPHKLWLIKRLLGDPNLTLGERFPDAEHKRQLMRGFVDELIADPDLHLVGLQLAAGIRDPEPDPVAGRRYLEAFTERVVDLEKGGQFEKVFDVETWMPEFPAPDAARRLIEVLPKLEGYHGEFLSRQLFREYDAGDVPEIRAAFEDHARRLIKNVAPKDRSGITTWMAFHRKNFLRKNPSADAARPGTNAVVVTRYWPVPSVAGGKQRIIVKAFARRDEVWLSVIERDAKDNIFWQVKTPSLDARPFSVKDRHGAHAFVVDDEAIYASYEWIPELVRVDRTTGAAEARPFR